MDIEEKINASAGRITADTLFTNVKVINVFTGEIQQTEIAVKNGYFCGSGDYKAEKTVDLNGKYMAPGFIDAHVHIESSMVTPAQFAKSVLPLGTTSVIADPHEIANVSGLDGIEFMIKSAETQDMNILFAFPSCVPATSMETSGAVFDPEKTKFMLNNEKIIALAEMMNYPGVIFTDPDVMAKIKACLKAGKPVDGHAPGLTGKKLSAYAAAGILSDHECTNAAEAMEKISLGMHIMIREGTCAKNLSAILPAVNDQTWRRMMWCTDDRHPGDILDHGHIDHSIRKAVRSGLDPVRAIQMATVNPAEYFNLKNTGAIAPGKRADFVIFKDLYDLRPEMVFAKGVLKGKNGRFCPDSDSFSADSPASADNLNSCDSSDSLNMLSMGSSKASFSPVPYPESMNLDISRIDLKIPVKGKYIKVIEIVPHQVVTNKLVMEVNEEKGFAVSDISRDLLKIAVIERYTGNSGTGKGFIKGTGLVKGAIASSVAHDSHNIIVAGTNDIDMLKAVKTVKEMGGGFAVTCNNEIFASLALPVAGLMSEEPMETVQKKMKQLIIAVKDLGSSLKDPFMTLGFLALPVIPRLKITDMGLVDVEKFKIVDLFN